ncbi:hypothetical protein [Eleftheria terrae]|uniref:hypothetical protein n=1 Tax=Eleftheria terrae TaxID=1597781 RepID=UPI00263BD35C|nr:hypothetical protein [Eleftheria terrae]WKB55961.1 hypothetical protein N7L95_28225 [Eleftheria terrae]
MKDRLSLLLTAVVASGMAWTFFSQVPYSMEIFQAVALAVIVVDNFQLRQRVRALEAGKR